MTITNLYLMTYYDLLTKNKVSIIIAKKIGVQHTKWKHKTAVLQRKYVQACFKTDLRLTFIDLQWPQNLLSVLEHVNQMKPEHWGYVTKFLMFWIIWLLLTMIRPLMTFIDLKNSWFKMQLFLSSWGQISSLEVHSGSQEVILSRSAKSLSYMIS